MIVQRFRKKPVVVEAIQFTGHDAYMEICAWMRGWGEDPCRLIAYSTPDMFVNTTEGRMQADLNDWIIRGTHGEFYPCKPDVFVTVYERLSTGRRKRTSAR